MAEKPAKIKKITVKEGNKEQDVVIAMTAEEGEDKSYVNYLESSIREKTANELRKQKPRIINPVKREILAGTLKEYQEYRVRKEKGERKYF